MALRRSIDSYKDMFAFADDATCLLAVPRHDAESISEWAESHRCSLKPDPDARGAASGCAGGFLTFEVSPSTIGAAITVRCGCGASMEVDN